jgi:MFS family permease
VNRSLQNNIRTIYLMGFCLSFLVVMPVYVPLLQGHGLSMAEVLQTQALFALTIALCEVPSGYLSDLWGRRPVILIGAALNAVAFLSLLWADSYMDFVIYEIILGVGFSLISGTDLALLYDTEVYLQVQELPGGAGAGKSLSRLIAVEAAASGFAGIAASVLLLWSLHAVLIVQVIAGVLPVLLAASLVEVPRAPRETSHRDNMRQIVELLLFGKPVVFWTAFAIAVFGLLAIYVFWIYQKYWELQGVPLASFGYIWAGFALMVSLSARFSGYLEQRLGTRRLLTLVALLPLLGLAGMALGNGWTGVLFGLLIQFSRGISMSLFYEALNSRVPGDFRATVNSLVSLGVRAVFIVTGPLLGYALDSLGMQSTLFGLLLLFAPLLAVVLVPLVIRIQRERAAAPAEAVSAG